MTDKATVEFAIDVVAIVSCQDIFRNGKPFEDRSQGQARSIFGGHLLGQSVSAAQQTLPSTFDVHSVQSTFLRPGHSSIDVEYHVERIMDGRTLASRLVRAKQGGAVIYVATIGFQRHADQLDQVATVLRYEAPMPDWAKMTEPDDKSLTSTHDLLVIDTGFPKDLVGAFVNPFDWFHLPIERRQDPTEVCARSFLRSTPLSTDNSAVHLASFAWLSDVFLIYTANWANPNKFPLGMAGVSIETTVNHSVWFHLPSARIDNWLACERKTSWGADGRVLIQQSLWNKADGQLVMTCVQEALLRLKRANL
ncbi:thioesterase-like superfamily-domain-containing protein [Truncatella angustata]|uniref:Thioesterase-like superfamily-domain-containing protein n=1 Tax=Truncatella angustata TaxID=152316 RepID=A0A9P8UKD5_9PEZI|nr:thioesterase-like superfamily-domain-containing protein [Truncatella angustata]KAH6653788.1 thioesterase-like superfamily-domain-containing protein [Truncatella angustata]KAH8194519.1 hypothetical protein TruAng_011318 [Truncatella angustata]